jgi:hypothetical protein
MRQSVEAVPALERPEIDENDPALERARVERAAIDPTGGAAETRERAYIGQFGSR